MPVSLGALQRLPFPPGLGEWHVFPVPGFAEKKRGRKIEEKYIVLEKGRILNPSKNEGQENEM